MPIPKAEFIEQLQCPKCGLKGIAEISDRSAYFGKDHDTSVKSVSDGFAAIERMSRLGPIDILCASCGVSAIRPSESEI